MMNEGNAPSSALSPGQRIGQVFGSVRRRVLPSAGGHGTFIAVAVILLLLLLYIVICVYWSLEPRTFDPVEAAYSHAVPAGIAAEGDPLPPGYVTVNTLVRVVETVLEKPGGYLRNNRLPPGVFMDNMPNWELGVILEFRKFATALREDFSRPQAQSPEQPALIEAEARFAFNPEAWMVPSPESQYREGIRFLRRYQEVLVQGGTERVSFAVRQDVLVDYLSQVEKRLGSLTIRLRANAGTYTYNPYLMQSAAEDPEAAGEEVAAVVDTTPWTQVDDVFYEARGSAWALYHLLKALRYDYQLILDRQLALGHMNRAMSELHAAIEPMRSPIVLNGQEFSLLPNHSLTLAAYLAKAHLAVVELRRVLTQPG